jgi:hypothetical protein
VLRGSKARCEFAVETSSARMLRRATHESKFWLAHPSIRQERKALRWGMAREKKPAESYFKLLTTLILRIEVNLSADGRMSGNTETRTRKWVRAGCRKIRVARLKENGAQ